MSIFAKGIPQGMTAKTLIEELDNNIPPVMYRGEILTDEKIQQMQFEAGQRDIVDRLVEALQKGFS